MNRALVSIMSIGFLVTLTACSSRDGRGLSDPIESFMPNATVAAIGGPLSFSHRTVFAICVEEEGKSRDLVSDEEVKVAEAVLAAMPEIEDSADWTSSGLEPAKVVAGCYVDAAPWADGYVQARRVDVPSVYTMHVILIDENSQRFNGFMSEFRIASEEDVCGGDVCSPVTIGFYITDREASDLEFLTEGLSYAIGIRPN